MTRHAAIVPRVLTLFGALVAVPALPAQDAAIKDPVLQRIWSLGMDSSQTYPLAQALLDSIGPRLTGTPQLTAAADWILSRYKAWGISARKEQYDSVPGWRRGYTHVDLVSPRTRTLEAIMVGFSPGTDGKDLEAEAILPPLASANVAAWLQQAKGKFVLVNTPEPTCRPREDWQHWALPDSKPGRPGSAAAPRATFAVAQLDSAGAAGALAGGWAGGWGTYKIQVNSSSKRAPHVRVGCEDYGLLYRLVENGQHPRVRVNAVSEPLGNVPVFDVIGEIKGTDKPDEYVMLSAHLDSWDASSGATDNGTGTVVMLEAMRILNAAYPKPKRTILVGHWSGEEQGEIGANAFVKTHPDVLQNLHVLFNQDDGTGRIASIGGEGFAAAEEYFKRWFSKVPEFFTKDIKLSFPGQGGNDSSDNDAFVEAGAPGFILSSLPWNYDTYTWHTNRDTFDKISFDDVKANATFIAMLTYLASEDAVKMPRK